MLGFQFGKCFDPSLPPSFMASYIFVKFINPWCVFLGFLANGLARYSKVGFGYF